MEHGGGQEMRDFGWSSRLVDVVIVLVTKHAPLLTVGSQDEVHFRAFLISGKMYFNILRGKMNRR